MTKDKNTNDRSISSISKASNKTTYNINIFPLTNLTLTDNFGSSIRRRTKYKYNRSSFLSQHQLY